MNTETNTAIRGRKCSEGDDSSSISRSSRIYSDAIRLGDVLSFLKDVQKFLDRLDHEPNLSHDCLDLKKSLASRIVFYTKLGSRPESGVYYNGRSECDSFDLPPPPPDSLPPTIRRNQTSPLPPPPSTCTMSLSSDDSLGYGTGGEPSSLDMSGDYHEHSLDIYSDDIQENYDRVQTPPPVMDPTLRTPPGTPPAKTSTPKGKRSSGFQSQMFENIPENPDEVEEEEYDAMEDEDLNNKPIPSCDFVGTSARILNSLADQKGWLWKKESMFKTSRFWALIYMSKLYLYNEANDEMKREEFNLEYASLKRHKKGVKFIVHISGTYKNKNAKQEFQTENSGMTEIWISALETAIATAGKLLSNPIPKTKQGFTSSVSSVNQESSLSSANNDSIEEDEQYDAIETSFELVKEPEEDEEYDLVEINRSGEYQDYDVPKPKGSMTSPIKERRSNTSGLSVSYGEDNKKELNNKAFKKQSSLPGVQLEDRINKSQIREPMMKKQSSVPSMRISQEAVESKDRTVKPKLTPRKHSDLQIPTAQSSLHTQPIDPPMLPKRGPPPLPSPRKLSPTFTKPNLTEEIHEVSDTGVRRKLFSETEDNTFDAKNNDDTKPVKPHTQFSSKTLQKPKKEKTENKVSESFRPRNKSESKPAMSNELAAILEKRRNNLQMPSIKPEIPVRPKNLTLTDSPTKDTFPPYSKVNKTGSKFVQDSSKPKNVSQRSPSQETSSNDISSRHIPKSFLHSFVNAGDMDPLQNKSW